MDLGDGTVAEFRVSAQPHAASLQDARTVPDGIAHVPFLNRSHTRMMDWLG